MKLNGPIVTYAVLGAVLFGLLGGGKKRTKMANIVKGATLGAALAFVGPRLGIRVPGTQAQLPDGGA